MKKLAAKLWAVLMLMLVSMQTMATDTFTSNRTDFRDESIYFMMTTRFYDGDTGNNVLCWDNQSAQIETKDPCWRGDFQGVIDKLDYIKALGFTAIWITPVVPVSYTHLDVYKRQLCTCSIHKSVISGSILSAGIMSVARILHSRISSFHSSMARS